MVNASSGTRGAKRAAKEGQRRQSKKTVSEPEPAPMPVVDQQQPDATEQAAAAILNSVRCYGKMYDPNAVECAVDCGWTEDCKLLMQQNNQAYDAVQAMVEQPATEAAVEEPPDDQAQAEAVAEPVPEAEAAAEESAPVEDPLEGAPEIQDEADATYQQELDQAGAEGEYVPEAVQEQLEDQAQAEDQPLAEGDVGDDNFGDDLGAELVDEAEADAVEAEFEQAAVDDVTDDLVPADDQQPAEAIEDPDAVLGDDLGDAAASEFEEGTSEAVAEFEEGVVESEPAVSEQETLDADAQFEAELDAELEQEAAAGDQPDLAAEFEAELDAETAPPVEGEYSAEELQDVAVEAVGAGAAEMDELEQALLEEGQEILEAGDMTDEELLNDLSDDPAMQSDEPEEEAVVEAEADPA